MTYTINSLSSEVTKYWAEIVAEVPKKGYKLDKPKKEIERGFEAYEAGQSKEILPFIVLGASHLREDEKVRQNLGSLATSHQTNEKTMRDFLHAANPDMSDKDLKKLVKTHLKFGCVMNDSNWWLFRNDLFILGGIHGQREFHLGASKKGIDNDDLLWDKNAKRPRVLGRELIMLQQAGYQRIQGSSKLGIVFAPPSEPVFPTLRQCKDAVKAVKSADEIRELFNQTFANDCSREPIIE